MVNIEVNVRVRFFDSLVGFGGLGGVPIDRKLLADRFGRILSPRSGIIIDFEKIALFSILLAQIPDLDLS